MSNALLRKQSPNVDSNTTSNFRKADHAFYTVLSKMIEGSYAFTDLLDGTTIANRKAKKQKSKESKIDSEESVYGEELKENDEYDYINDNEPIHYGKRPLSNVLLRQPGPVIDVNEHDFREVQDYEIQNALQVINSGNTDDEGKVKFTIKNEENNNDPINNAKLDEIVQKYTYRDKLLAASLLYCCKRISPDQLGALISSIDPDPDIVKNNIEYVNSICKYFTDYYFVSNAEYEDREFNLEDNQIDIIREITCLDLLNGNPVTSQIIERLREWARKNNKTVIIFDNSKLDLFQSDAPKSMMSLIEGAFGELLKDFNHKISKLPNGLAEISIARDYGVVDTYIVDPGLILGQGAKVLVPSYNGSDYFTSNLVILRKAFLNKAYQMNAEEVKNVITNENQFYNQFIYNVYDFSNSARIFKDASREDIDALEARLKLVMDIVDRQFGGLCRLRLKNYKDPNTFIIVSDDKCKSPMDESIHVLFHGLVIKIHSGKIDTTIADVNGNLIFSNSIQLDSDEQQLVNDFKVPVDFVLDQRNAIPPLV